MSKLKAYPRKRVTIQGKAIENTTMIMRCEAKFLSITGIFLKFTRKFTDDVILNVFFKFGITCRL